MARGRITRGRQIAGSAVLFLMMQGSLAQASEAQAAQAQGSRSAPASPAAPVATGEQVYARWCVHCHAAGRGNPGTESLQVKYRGNVPAVLLERSDLTPQAITQFVRQGVLSMPPFRKTEISDAELAALATFMARPAQAR